MNTPFSNVKTQLLELPVIANTTLRKFFFPTQNFLRAKKIVSLETYSNEVVTFTPQGNVTPTPANIKSAFLTLYGENPEAANADGEWMVQIPLASLNRTIFGAGATPGVFDLYSMTPRNIVWEKSYVEIFDPAGLGNTDPLSFTFLVGYTGNEGD